MNTSKRIGRAEAPEFYSDFGERVRAVRALRGMRVGDLSAAAGLTEAAVSNAERGPNRVSLHAACSLARGLGVDIGDLLPAPGERAARTERALRGRRCSVRSGQ